MKELMLELLTYEPFGEFLSEEETYICEILSGNDNPPPSLAKFHELFLGFYNYYIQNIQNRQNGNPKNISWLRRWKNTYHQNKNYTNSTKSGRVYYPLLFKKICFYIIVRGKFSDTEFMRRIDLRVSLIKKWNISTRFRRYAEADTYSAIRSYRRGVKKEYIVSIVKKLYYEAGLQVYQKRPKKRGDSKNQEGQESRLMILKNLPVFVDVFAGTASVAASMVTDGCPPPVVNDYDPVMVCFAWAFTHCQRRLRKEIINFHKYLMKHAINPEDSSYDLDDYRRRFDRKEKNEFPEAWRDPQNLWWFRNIDHDSEEDIKKGEEHAQCHQDFAIRTRSGYKDVTKILKLDEGDRERLRKIDFNKRPPSSDDQIEDVLDYALALFFYYSFAPSGTSSGGVYFSATNVTVDSYLKYLGDLGVNLNDIESEKDKAAKAQKLLKLQLKASSLTLESTESSSSHESTRSFSRHLKDAKFYCEPFQDILKLGSDKIYYLDSPYFLTVGYDVGFSDDDHKKMLDILRDDPQDASQGAKFKWIFSMQYNPSARNTCTITSDEAKRRKQPYIIKDYGAYYRGFYAKFELDADQRTYYVPIDAPKGKAKKLFAILFDVNAAEAMGQEIYRNTSEMLVVNFNCLSAIPLHDSAVVLPFDLFLQCADAGMDYKDIVQRAIAWRKENIEKNYASKVPV